MWHDDLRPSSVCIMYRRFFAIVLLSPMFAFAAQPCTDRPLNILLVNDDGFDTPGIIALHRELKASGHNVRRVAPDRNYSGSSASLTIDLIAAPRIPDEEFTEVYAVSGSPATAVLVGATAIFPPEQPVDLVVSGINEGANLGPATVISGTVGATIAAMKALARPIPGIAVSTNPIAEDEAAPENHRHLKTVAGFTSRLVRRLFCASQPWSKGELALNVNYPPLEPEAVKGVRVAAQGKAPYYSMGFKAAAPDRYAPDFGRAEPSQDIENADTFLFRQGYITIVPIDGDYTAGGRPLPASLEDLEP
jgi:5'/3'-nucleotidase SurE